MKKIVTVGGGTGTFVVLSGLKKHRDASLTAIVSVADDGGSTGRLRDAYGMLPPGDVRQALVALSDDETSLRKLFTHRFAKGDIAGHNFGNLYLTALTEIFGSDQHALDEAMKLLRVRGRVVPVSHSPTVLCASYADGSCVEGQSSVARAYAARGSLTKLYLKELCHACDDALVALKEADLIVLGPGDIYTSTLANFVVHGLADALQASHGRLVYVMNLFSTPESGTMTAAAYIDAVATYAGRAPDVVLINTGLPPQEALKHYAEKGQQLIIDDLGPRVRTIRADFLSRTLVERASSDVVDRSLIRHDSDKLADVLIQL